MSFGSLWRLRDYEIRRARGDVRDGARLVLDMKWPVKGTLTLREAGSDMLTFMEVIRSQVYRDVLVDVQQCETIIDLGANIGLSSLYFAGHYPSCRIFAVEPNLSSYELLAINLKQLIERGRCKALQAAVWDSEATLEGSSDSPDHYSAFTMCEAKAENKGNVTSIAGLPMGKIIDEAGFDYVDVVKVDVEGAEVALFTGDLNWLRLVKAIAIEFHGESRRETRFDQIMREYGFVIASEGVHTIVALNRDRL